MRQPTILKYPLSLIQEPMWEEAQTWPQLTQNMLWTAQLTGKLEIHILEQCLDDILSRHEILRSTFGCSSHGAFQAVHPHLDVTLQIEDLSGRSRAEAYDKIKRRARKLSDIPFDLRIGPLWKPILYRVGHKTHVLLIIMHHIIGDLWSFRVLLDELSILYGAYSQGNPSPLIESPTQYHEYATWQRQRLAGGYLRRLLSFWMKQLAGVAGDASDQTHGIQSAGSAGRSMHCAVIKHEAIDTVRKLLRREHVTRFMVVLLALSLALFKRTKRADVIALATVANRAMPLSDNLMGPCANTVVLRIDLSGNPTLRELLRRIRGVTLAALENSELPFPLLVEEVIAANPQAAVYRCDVSINMTRRRRVVHRPSLQMRDVQIGRERASRRYPHVAVTDEDCRVVVSVYCDGDVFSKSDLRQVTKDMKGVLTNACSDPDANIGAYL